MLNMLAPPGKVDDTFGNGKVRLDSESICEELEIWSFVDEHDWFNSVFDINLVLSITSGLKGNTCSS